MASDRSSAAVDTGNDMDSPLAVVIHGSCAAVGTCDNGDHPLAVIGSEGLKTDSIAQPNVRLSSSNNKGWDTYHCNDQVNGAFPFQRLPTEIQNKIIGLAVLAKNHEINFSCLTNTAFAPNITVGLLLVNHRIYHEAHYQLRKQNVFIFNNFGFDLRIMALSVGPLKCRSGACGYGPLDPTLAKVVFDLGDEDLPYTASDKLLAFGNALRYMRSPIIINVLHIKLAYHTFEDSAQLSHFAAALSVVKVKEKLVITGDEQVLDMSYEALPRKLGMYMLPVYSRFEAYSPELQYSPGWFLHQYEPAPQADEVDDPQQIHLIPDVIDESYTAEMAIRQLVG